MGNELFDRVVLIASARVPLQAEAIVENGLRKAGADPATVTPSQMRKALNKFIVPEIQDTAGSTEKNENIDIFVIRTGIDDNVLSISKGLPGFIGMGRNISASGPELFQKLLKLGLVARIEDFYAIRQDAISRRVDAAVPDKRRLDVSIALIRDDSGMPVETVSFVQDVTLSENFFEEVSLLYDKMEKAKIFSDNIIESMADMLVVVNPDATIMAANKAFLSRLGYQKNELTGVPVKSLFGEDIMPFLLQGEKWKESHAQGSLKSLSLSCRAKDGLGVPMSVSGAFAKNPAWPAIIPRKPGAHNEDKIAGCAVIVAREIKDAAGAQDEGPQQSSQELQDARHHLKKVQSQLVQSEKIAVVAQLAGGLAHELNNPLGVILGFSQAINKRVKENDPLHAPLTAIEREAKRCKNLVQELMTFYKFGLTDREECNLNEVVEDLLLMIEAEIRLKSINLVQEFDKSPAVVSINITQIHQVIADIIRNAVDAMPNGGTLKVSGKRVKTGETEYAEIRVCDTGNGIPKDIRSKIFEPFFTTKEVGKGTGLSLSLDYEIIKKHNGLIELESEEGKGTKFIILIPVVNI